MNGNFIIELVSCGNPSLVFKYVRCGNPSLIFKNVRLTTKSKGCEIE